MHRYTWRPVDGGFHWNLKASSAVCKQLDCGSAVSTERSVWFTREPVWRITPYCAGSESSLSDCVLMETSHTTRKGLVTGRPTVICSGNSGLLVLLSICQSMLTCLSGFVETFIWGFVGGDIHLLCCSLSKLLASRVDKAT